MGAVPGTPSTDQFSADDDGCQRHRTSEASPVGVGLGTVRRRRTRQWFL